MDPAVTEAVRAVFVALAPLFDERLRRRWAAVEARGIGRGGIARVAAATGMSRTTIRAGLRELEAREAPDAEPDSGRARRRGGGRKPLTTHDPNLTQALERLVDPVTRGDPMGPLLWTCSSAARLAEKLQAIGHPVSERTVNRLLHELGYSLQANRMTLEGNQHADRDAQFQIPQSAGTRVSARAAASSFRGHREKGADRRVSQRRSRVATEGAAGAGQGARLR